MDKEAKLKTIKGYVESVKSNYPLRICLARRGVVEAIGEIFSLGFLEDYDTKEIKGYMDKIEKILPDIYTSLMVEIKKVRKEDSENLLEHGDSTLAEEYREQKKKIDEIKARLKPRD